MIATKRIESASKMYATDYKVTHRRLVDTLKSERRPLHYREAYSRCVSLDYNSALSDKTDPAEKLRQYYAEHDKPDILFVGNGYGYFALKQWFPLRIQPSLLPPDEQVVVSGDMLVSHDAGYEHAKREPYMMNHYGKTSIDLYQRRRSGLLVESHVEGFFKRNYPEFYRPPSNEHDYKSHCDHDFCLVTPSRMLKIDVKSWSYKVQGGESNTAVISNPKDVLIYLFADLLPDDNGVVMRGMATGDMVRFLGLRSEASQRSMFHISENYIWSIDVLLVFLNMAKCNMSWHDFESCIKF